MPNSQRRILIVDDDSLVCKTLVLALEPLGASITQAHTAAEGMHQLRDHVFDVVLLDLGLPDGSGLDVLRDARHSRARFIIITADSNRDRVLDAVKARAFDYIMKPFHIDQVVTSVERALAAAENTEIEIHSAKPEWVELSLPCTRDCAERIENFMRNLKLDLPEAIRDSVTTAMRELLMNAVEWGGGLDPNRRVRVSCLRTHRLIEYRISDPGPGFRFEKLGHAAIGHTEEEGPMAHMPLRESLGLRPGGLGLVMVKALADELLFNEEQNEVVLIKYLD